MSNLNDVNAMRCNLKIYRLNQRRNRDAIQSLTIIFDQIITLYKRNDFFFSCIVHTYLLQGLYNFRIFRLLSFRTFLLHKVFFFSFFFIYLKISAEHWNYQFQFYRLHVRYAHTIFRWTVYIITGHVCVLLSEFHKDVHKPQNIISQVGIICQVYRKSV